MSSGPPRRTHRREQCRPSSVPPPEEAALDLLVATTGGSRAGPSCHRQRREQIHLAAGHLPSPLLSSPCRPLPPRRPRRCEVTACWLIPSHLRPVSAAASSSLTSTVRPELMGGQWASKRGEARRGGHDVATRPDAVLRPDGIIHGVERETDAAADGGGARGGRALPH
ncbi:hypothetical protein BS78_03G164500 [Paspalum vaginatum]|nr:hypothetical protein BS78_03G164500 [Paspalum vaginatum]